jgi:hypothetical protein
MVDKVDIILRTLVIMSAIATIKVTIMTMQRAMYFLTFCCLGILLTIYGVWTILTDYPT